MQPYPCPPSFKSEDDQKRAYKRINTAMYRAMYTPDAHHLAEPLDQLRVAVRTTGVDPIHGKTVEEFTRACNEHTAKAAMEDLLASLVAPGPIADLIAKDMPAEADLERARKGTFGSRPVVIRTLSPGRPMDEPIGPADFGPADAQRWELRRMEEEAQRKANEGLNADEHVRWTRWRMGEGQVQGKKLFLTRYPLPSIYVDYWGNIETPALDVENAERSEATPYDGNPKTELGRAKPRLSLVPTVARIMIAEAFRDGSDKYGPANWRHDKVSASTYLDACHRHLAQWEDGEENDPAPPNGSGVHHLAHAAACLAILLDAQANGMLIDDRAPKGVAGDLIREKTRRG